jgi:hypothetical protein
MIEQNNCSFGIKQQSLTQSKLIESPKCQMVGALASSVVWIVEGSIHFKVRPKNEFNFYCFSTEHVLMSKSKDWLARESG